MLKYPLPGKVEVPYVGPPSPPKNWILDDNTSSAPDSSLTPSSHPNTSPSEHEKEKVYPAKCDFYDTMSDRSLRRLMKALKDSNTNLPPNEPKSHNRESDITCLRKYVPPQQYSDTEEYDDKGNLKTFPIFKKLPPEMRQMIWNAAMEPRIITIHAEKASGMPAIFSICIESRIEALRKYIILRQDHGRWNKMYFNPDIDTIFMMDNIFQHYFSFKTVGRKVACKIKYLALETTFETFWMSHCFKRWRNVRELTLLKYSPKEEGIRSRFALDPTCGLGEDVGEEEAHKKLVVSFKKEFVKWGGNSRSVAPEVSVKVGVLIKRCTLV